MQGLADLEDDESLEFGVLRFFFVFFCVWIDEIGNVS